MYDDDGVMDGGADSIVHVLATIAVVALLAIAVAMAASCVVGATT